MASARPATSPVRGSTFQGISLWLSPPPSCPSDSGSGSQSQAPVVESLSHLIGKLSKSHPPSPPFPPHVTLFTGIPTTISDFSDSTDAGPSPSEWIERVVDRVQHVVDDWKASNVTGGLEIRFDGLEHGKTYFKCVFLSVEKSPELMSLYESVRKHLMPMTSLATPRTSGPSRTGDAVERLRKPYEPHLSLLYGDLSDEEKERVVRDLRGSEEVEVVEGGGEGGGGGKVEVKVGEVRGFRPVEVQIVKTEGKSEDWEVIGSVPL